MTMETVYDIRTCRAYNALSDVHFKDANHSGILAILGGGCIDAPDQHPAGSVKSYGKGWLAQALPSLCARTEDDENNLLDRRALAKALIAQVAHDAGLKPT